MTEIGMHEHMGNNLVGLKHGRFETVKCQVGCHKITGRRQKRGQKNYNIDNDYILDDRREIAVRRTKKTHRIDLVLLRKDRMFYLYVSKFVKA
jgi:hypothetical protein